MAFKGRGRGRGRGGFGGGGYNQAKQVSFELFPEIESLGKAVYSDEKKALISCSWSTQKYWNSSIYYYEDKNECAEKKHKPDIERYSDRKLQGTESKPPLWHIIRMDTDHMPAELARGERRPTVQRVRWNPEADLQKLDVVFEKLEQKSEGQEGKEKKKNEEDEEKEEQEEEEEGDFSDEGDYEQAEYFDDDEDDFNMADDNNDEPFY